jgi:hypothetical protein
LQNPYAILQLAKEEPLYVEPALLDLIIKYVTEGLTMHDVWHSAWGEIVNARTATSTSIPVGLPTPPDPDLFIAIAIAAQSNPGWEPREILRQAHDIVGREDSPVWPRHIAPDLLAWVIILTPLAPLGAEDQIGPVALQWLEATGGQFPPEPPADPDLIRSIALAARLYQGAAPRDLRNIALGAQLDTALEPFDCGGHGQLCCSDPVDSCNGVALCDWDNRCRVGLWPSAEGYVQNQTFPPLELDRDWTEEVQGLASWKRFWYVVQGMGWNSASNNRLWKVPFEVDWDFDWGDYDYEASNIRIARNRYNTPFVMDHWGDPDVYGDRVYVPMEDNTPDYNTNMVAEFDADTLAYLGSSNTYTNHAASVAVHPKTGKFYVMNNFYASESCFRGLQVYKARGEGPFRLRKDRTITLELPPGVAPPNDIQGIAFSPSGKLYVSASQGVYAFQVSPNRAIFQHLLDVGVGDDEVEGLTVRDFTWPDGSRSQIHVLILVNVPLTANDNAWFKHITVKDGRY